MIPELDGIDVNKKMHVMHSEWFTTVVRQQ